MPFEFKDGSKPGVCKTCGKPSWSPRSNACLEHKKTPAVKAKASSKRIGGAEASAKPILTQAVEAAGEITAKTFGSRPPTAQEWEDKLTALVVLLTMTYVEYVVVRPFQLPEPNATNAVAALGMTDDEARTIVEPCSYLMAKTEINKKHGREAIEVLAFAPAILAVVGWADRVSQFRREMSLQQGDPNVRLESTEAASGPSGAGPVIANFRGVTDPSQAPTARVNGDGAHVDLTAPAFTA